MLSVTNFGSVEQEDIQLNIYIDVVNIHKYLCILHLRGNGDGSVLEVDFVLFPNERHDIPCDERIFQYVFNTEVSGSDKQFLWVVNNLKSLIYEKNLKILFGLSGVIIYAHIHIYLLYGKKTQINLCLDGCNIHWN
jgi:hypothetical protein